MMINHAHITWERLPYIIYHISILNLIWGVLLIVHTEVTEFAVLGGASWLLDHLPDVIVGPLLLSIGLLALSTLLHSNKGWSILLIMPQYFVSIGTLLYNIYLVIEGEYKGESIDRGVLFAALSPFIVAGSLHTLAVIERYRLWKP